ncbi:hypothetical protein [Snodgrassella sp. ESL0253]|nr:hypothetical protein [Snodgrassella sp. ESL0253]NUE66592.1 hypothetical protein [Snodgrassella sp. ESL0253]
MISAKNDYKASYTTDKTDAAHIMNSANKIKNHTRAIGVANGAAKA